MAETPSLSKLLDPTIILQKKSSFSLQTPLPTVGCLRQPNRGAGCRESAEGRGPSQSKAVGPLPKAGTHEQLSFMLRSPAGSQ